MVAITPTRPEFVDTYWIIPKYSTTPYGKVSFSTHFIKNPLPVLWHFAYSNHALVNPSDRFSTLLLHKATVDAEDSRVFFYVVDDALQHSMVALSGQSSDWLVSLCASSANPDSVTAHKDISTSSGDFLNQHKEIASMATIPSQTRLEFVAPRHCVVETSKNLPLRNQPTLAYIPNQHLNKTGAGFDSLNCRADIGRYKRFFCVRDNQRYVLIMVGGNGGAERLAGFSTTGLSIPLRLATLFDSRVRGFKKLSREAATMVATIPTRLEFVDTYWIIPRYATTPYGKVSFSTHFIKNPLPFLWHFAYSNHALVNPSDRFRSLLLHKATIDAEDSRVFFYVVDDALQHSMVALSGQSSDWLVSLCASTANLDIVTAHCEFRSSSGDFLNQHKEIASMATIPNPTRPEFIAPRHCVVNTSKAPYLLHQLVQRQLPNLGGSSACVRTDMGGN